MYSFSVNALDKKFEDRRMWKPLVEVTGDTPRHASCLHPTVIKKGSNDRTGVVSSVETLLRLLASCLCSREKTVYVWGGGKEKQMNFCSELTPVYNCPVSTNRQL